jgi:hypothetical protein
LEREKKALSLQPLSERATHIEREHGARAHPPRDREVFWSRPRAGKKAKKNKKNFGG